MPFEEDAAFAASSAQEEVPEDGNKLKKSERLSASGTVASALEHALLCEIAVGGAGEKTSHTCAEDEQNDPDIYLQKRHIALSVAGSFAAFRAFRDVITPALPRML